MRESLDGVDLDRSSNRGGSAHGAVASSSAAQQVRRALRGKHVCPFCGTQRETDVGACMHCSLEDTPATRSATRSKLGPWYVLQSRNPSAPGMNFATLMVLVQKGRVTARSVLRGPTTGQFWRHAAKVKGVSREFGLCWNCGGDVPRNARACPNCKSLQEPPLNPNVMLESAEFSGEELAEAMWADEAPESSQMPASHSTIQPVAPSPVDRLASRGGVRREVSTKFQPPPASAIRTPPARTQSTVPVAEPAAHSALEMAVFQRSPDAEARRTGIVGRVFKSMLIALLLAAAGVILMSSFDAGFRSKMIQWVDKAQAWSREKIGSRKPANPAPDAVDANPLNAQDAKTKAWELWKSGVDAEERGDFAGAVKNWEAIKKLSVPEDELPLGLDGRIAAAKKRVK